MFDRGFGPEVRAVLAPLRSKAAPARVVLVCATLTPASTLLCVYDWITVTPDSQDAQIVAQTAAHRHPGLAGQAFVGPAGGRHDVQE